MCTTLLYNHSVDEAFHHTYEFLEMCVENGIKARPDKFHFCRKSVTFSWYLLGWEEC